jgi:hypothetical protein
MATSLGGLSDRIQLGVDLTERGKNKRYRNYPQWGAFSHLTSTKIDDLPRRRTIPWPGAASRALRQGSMLNEITMNVDGRRTDVGGKRMAEDRAVLKNRL